MRLEDKKEGRKEGKKENPVLHTCVMTASLFSFFPL
jgi:hypothetical protein